MNVPWTDIASWWLRLALAGGLLLLAGLAVVAARRRPAVRLRAGAWTFLAALLLVPLTLLPGWFALPWGAPAAAAEPQAGRLWPRPAADVATGGPPVAEAPAAPQSPHDGRMLAFAPAFDEPAAEEAPPAPAETGVVPAPAVAGVAELSRPSFAWVWNALLLAYAAAVAVLLGRLALGQWQLVRLWRTARPAPVAVRQLFYRLTRRRRCRPALRVSDRVAGPICFGVFRPRIVLPAALAGADEQGLRWVLAHELGHLERRDPLVGWLTGLAQSLFFLWPWFWKLRRAVRLDQEYLADADAVRATTAGNETTPATPAEDYADFLLRLTGGREVPAGASGVKTPSSDLYRRITMLLKKSGNVEGRCPRRWSLVAGGGLLGLGVVLAGLHFAPRHAAAAAADEKKAEAPKKESVEDVEDTIRKALESLKKGPAPAKQDAEPAKDPAKNNKNVEDEFRKAEEAMRKAQRDLQENPRSDENRRAFQKAVQEYQDAFRKRMEANRVAPFPAVPFQPIDPNIDAQRMVDDLQRAMEELQRQFPFNPLDPNAANPRIRIIGPNFGRGIGGVGGFGGAVRASGDVRLGVRLEKPNAALVEQLDLPADKGMVVTEVMPDSAAAKAGIKANDILLEIGGKPVPSDPAGLRDVLKGFKADEKVAVTVLRKGKKETIKDVSLPEAKPAVGANPFDPNLPAFPRIEFPNFPMPNVPNIGNPRLRINPLRPNGFPPEAFGGGKNVSFSVSTVNGEVTIKYAEDGVKYTITGAKDDGGVVSPSGIEIDDHGKTIKADSLEKLDKEHRDTVEKLLKRVR